MTTLIFLLFASLFISQSSQESPELAEATELTKSVVKLFKEGKFDEALPLAKRALEIRERLLPPNDQRVSLSLGYLGDVYLAKRDYSSARKAFERLLLLQEERLGPTDVNLTFTLDRLALLSFRDGKPEKSEELYQRSLAIREKAFGGESLQVADTLYSLGQLYRMRGKYDRALDSYKRSLLIYGHSKEVGTAEFLRTSTGITCVGYESQNKAIFKEAEAIQKLFASGVPFAPPAEVLNGRAVVLAKPEYPTAARDRNLEGTVVVQVEIDEKGNVTAAKDLCGSLPYLDESAIRA
ncbi:MAG TPA: TonB family protein, partial [Pyrinomonadaceae bacterium]|nr:TonB family protein [Pyrinomonadaceae bacterium]